MSDLRLYISPFFVSRYYRSKDIKQLSKNYEVKGSLIDVGCGTKPHAKDFPNTKYYGIDFKDFSVNKDFSQLNPDYFFGKNYTSDYKLPFKDAEFDNALSFQVVEHHERPDILISEMARIVKTKGYIIITAPFLGGLHEEPYDFQRLTKYKIKNILHEHGCEIIEFKEQGSIFSTIAMLLNEQNAYLTSKGRLSQLTAVLLHIPLLIFSYTTLLLDLVFKSKTIYFNYMIVARKTNA